MECGSNSTHHTFSFLLLYNPEYLSAIHVIRDNPGNVISNDTQLIIIRLLMLANKNPGIISTLGFTLFRDKELVGWG